MTTTFTKPTINSKNATQFLGGAAALGALGFGLLNLSTAGIPALTGAAIAGAIALSSREKAKQKLEWRNNLQLQGKYVGRNTANYLISTLETIDSLIIHKMYKTSRWIAGTTYTGVHVMVSSKGDFKVFNTKDEMLQMAHFFVNDLPFNEAGIDELKKLQDKPVQTASSVIDFIADNQLEVHKQLPLGRLIRIDHRHLDLEDYKVKNQSWQVVALDNGMFVAMRGSKHLTYRVFRDRESFWRFYSKAVMKDKRYFLPSQELGENLEAVLVIDEETDLIKCFLEDITFVEGV